MNKLQNFPPVYYISIEESEDRRQFLHSQFQSHGITNFTPCIYKRYAEYGHQILGKNVEFLAEGSKGPITSHLKTIKRWLESTTEDYCMVIEDDLSLETVEHWNFTWSEFFERLPKNWDVVQLCMIRPDTFITKLHPYLKDNWSCAAYIIHRKYAQKLVDMCFLEDHFFLGEWDSPIVENVIYNNTGNVFTIPLFVEEVHKLSTTIATEYGGAWFINHDSGTTQGECHFQWYDITMNWWKTIGCNMTVDEITTLDHIYQQPEFGENWFSYPNLYAEMVRKFPSGSKFVEIGCWKGKSSSFMAIEILNSRKNIEFTCVDTWEGSREHENISHDDLYGTFLSNMRPLAGYYSHIRNTSLSASSEFADSSLDFVFIDASHEYEDVKADILAWLPKVKPGGILAGHDYYAEGYDYFPGVKQAVNEVLPSVQTSEDCWIFVKPDGGTEQIMNYNFVAQVLSSGGRIIPLIINSEHTNGTGLFNPSVQVDGDDVLINVRHCQYTLYHSEKNVFEHQYGPLVYLNPENDITLTTTNYLSRVDPNTYEVESWKPIDMSDFNVDPIWEFVGLEDVRLVRWNGKLYISGVRRDTTPTGVGRMELSEIVDTKEVSRFRIPAPGANDSYCEKNWMPIVDMPYHYVKWCNPTEIVRVDPITKTCQQVFLGKAVSLPKDYRGGSQVIPIGDKRIALTHTVSLFQSEAGRKNAIYRHSFVVWDKEWNVLKYGPEFDFMGASIEFCCGIAEHRDNYLITFGYQDNSAYLLVIPKSSKLLEAYIND